MNASPLLTPTPLLTRSWSAVSRAERYRKRREDAGEDAAALLAEVNATNPLPGFLDPITLEPVVNPAISPFGHVMGLATWRAVLAEQVRHRAAVPLCGCAAVRLCGLCFSSPSALA